MNFGQTSSNPSFWLDAFDSVNTSTSSGDSKMSEVGSSSGATNTTYSVPGDMVDFGSGLPGFSSRGKVSSKNIWAADYKNDNPLNDLSSAQFQTPRTVGEGYIAHTPREAFFLGHSDSYSGLGAAINTFQGDPWTGKNYTSTANSFTHTNVPHALSNDQRSNSPPSPYIQCPQPVVPKPLPTLSPQLQSSVLSKPNQRAPIQKQEQKRTEMSFKNYAGSQFVVKPNSMFFVIKSFNLADVNASFINSIWASTELGNRRLSAAYKRCRKNGGDVFLFFSVNKSGKFCGIAKMTSDVDFNKSSDIWSEGSKWKGVFNVEWIFMKDIPNRYFQHLKVPANENKSVTNSRDTQEVPFDVAVTFLRIYSTFRSSSSFLI